MPGAYRQLTVLPVLNVVWRLKVLFVWHVLFSALKHVLLRPLLALVLAAFAEFRYYLSVLKDTLMF